MTPHVVRTIGAPMLLFTLLACQIPHTEAAPPPTEAPPASVAEKSPVTEAPLAEAAPVPTHPAVEAARKYLGRPYSFGARGDELDCMGLVFLAWSDANGHPWRKLSVNPTEIVAKRQLGPPVDGLAGVATADVDYTRFRPGDVIFFLGPAENPAEPSLVRVGDVPWWVLHMGMWTGEGRFIVGDHFAGEVVEQPLAPYLAEHRGQYTGIFVVRP